MSRDRGTGPKSVQYPGLPPTSCVIVRTEGVKGRAQLSLSFHSSDNEMPFSAAGRPPALLTKFFRVGGTVLFQIQSS